MCSHSFRQQLHSVDGRCSRSSRKSVRCLTHDDVPSPDPTHSMETRRHSGIRARKAALGRQRSSCAIPLMEFRSETNATQCKSTAQTQFRSYHSSHQESECHTSSFAGAATSRMDCRQAVPCQTSLVALHVPLAQAPPAMIPTPFNGGEKHPARDEQQQLQANGLCSKRLLVLYGAGTDTAVVSHQQVDMQPTDEELFCAAERDCAILFCAIRTPVCQLRLMEGSTSTPNPCCVRCYRYRPPRGYSL